jgi:hypothetical protein
MSDRWDESARIYGIMAEFDNPTDLVVAAERAYAAGYRKMDAYTPYPIEEVAHALGHHRSLVPLLVLIAGVTGGVFAFVTQWWAAEIDYPLIIGGKPFNSWPMFIPITFEVTILFAAITAVVGMILLNGLPLPYHPVFNHARFERASQDGFFLCIEAADPLFDRTHTANFLKTLNPREVAEVEA